MLCKPPISHQGEHMNRGGFRRFLFFLWIPLFISTGFGQENDVCVSCHEDESLETVRYGVRLSLFVTEEHLEGTPHEGFNCVDCHTDLEGVEEFPHPSRLTLPDCGSCHQDAQKEFVEGFFQPLIDKGYTSIPTCSDCHGRHKVSWVGHPRKVCGVCHQDILNDFFLSAHWDEKEEISEVACVSCHNPHFKHEKVAYEESDWRIHLTESCSKCHVEEVRNYTSSRHYRELREGNLNAPVCSDCHDKHRVLSPRNPESKVSVAKLDRVCTRCHEGYEASIHRPEVGDDPRLETCVACHKGHSTDMVAGSESSIFEMNLSEVCLKCHKASLITGENDAHGGIHRNQIQRMGWGELADCGLCHVYHFRASEQLLEHGLEKSCADCHPQQQNEYERSSHYVARAKGHEEAPGCMTCHGERVIQRPDPYFTGQSVVELCGSCHGNREMILKFQLNPDVIKGYNTSYHGQMYQLGYQGEEFATCVSCHDNHSILPHTDPAATTHQKSILNTCAQCHEEVNINFVSYLQHYSPMVREKNPILGFIDTFMLWLLGGTLTVFGGHTILWLVRLLIRRFTEGPLKKRPKTEYRVKRFNRVQRLMHLVIILSFLILATTGLPLKYSHTAIANWFARHIVGFGTAAILHRIAATLLGSVLSLHILQVLYAKFVQKKTGILYGPNSLMPRWQDFKDFFAHISYFVGAREKPPPFGRWTYWEKFDYFAVFWGMLIIGSSGLTLWFPEFFTRLLPGWVINAAHIIHSEEALLATAFIFTVHFFNTHLRPGAFPMDDVMFSGYATEDQFKEERQLQYGSLTEEEYRGLLTGPHAPWLKRLFYVAGYTFLFMGFFLLILIVIGTFF